MRLLLITLLLINTISYSQYSNYYNLDVNSNVNQNVNLTADVNVNKNVNVSGNVNKTITTIDYGALRLANAQAEKNRLEAQMYANETARIQALEIASNPLKAFDYGEDNYYQLNKEEAEARGWRKNVYHYHKIPHKSLFVNTGGWNYRNESENGVITELEIGSFFSLFTTTGYKKMSKKEKEKEWWIEYLGKTEEFAKYQEQKFPIGKVIEGNYVHKHEVKKAKFYGQDGFVSTMIYENDYEIAIKDNYVFISTGGFYALGSVRYKGDKQEVTFEDLEGRRAYFKRLMNQTFATLNIIPSKKGKEIMNN
jgi:hypothetical protein